MNTSASKTHSIISDVLSHPAITTLLHSACCTILDDASHWTANPNRRVSGIVDTAAVQAAVTCILRGHTRIQMSGRAARGGLNVSTWHKH